MSAMSSSSKRFGNSRRNKSFRVAWATLAAVCLLQPTTVWSAGFKDRLSPELLVEKYGVGANQFAGKCGAPSSITSLHDYLRMAPESHAAAEIAGSDSQSSRRLDLELKSIDNLCPPIRTLGALNPKSVRKGVEDFLAGRPEQKPPELAAPTPLTFRDWEYSCRDTEKLWTEIYSNYTGPMNGTPEELEGVAGLVDRCGAYYHSIGLVPGEERIGDLWRDVNRVLVAERAKQIMKRQRRSPDGLVASCIKILSNLDVTRSGLRADSQKDVTRDEKIFGKPILDWTDQDVAFMQQLPTQCRNEQRAAELNPDPDLSGAAAKWEMLPKFVKDLQQTLTAEAHLLAENEQKAKARADEHARCRATRDSKMFSVLAQLNNSRFLAGWSKAVIANDDAVAGVSGVSDANERRGAGQVLVESKSNIARLFDEYKALGGTATRLEDVPNTPADPCPN